MFPSVSSRAYPVPTSTASSPRLDAYVPMTPVRCILIAFWSTTRVSTIALYMAVNSFGSRAKAGRSSSLQSKLPSGSRKPYSGIFSSYLTHSSLEFQRPITALCQFNHSISTVPVDNWVLYDIIHLCNHLHIPTPDNHITHVNFYIYKKVDRVGNMGVKRKHRN